MKYSSYNIVASISATIKKSIENDYDDYEEYCANYTDIYKIFENHISTLNLSIVSDLKDITGLDFYVEKNFFHLLDPSYIIPWDEGHRIISTVKTHLDPVFEMEIRSIVNCSDIKCRLIKGSYSPNLHVLSHKFNKKNDKYQDIELKNL